MNQEKIGNFIAQCRKEQNNTQEQLAELLGVNSRTISKWETGRGLPNLSSLEPLCEVLNITLDELFSGEHIEKECVVEDHERNMKELLSYSGEKLKNKNHFLGLMFFRIRGFSHSYCNFSFTA